MSWWLNRLRPGQFPGLRLGERYVQDLLKARQNPLKRYQLARACLYYAEDKTGAGALLVREVVFQDALKGTALEKQSIVDLVRVLADMSTAKPGVYNITMLSQTGYAFGTIVSESIRTPSFGATMPQGPDPEAPRRIVLAAVSDVAKAAAELAQKAKQAAEELRCRSRSGSGPG